MWNFTAANYTPDVLFSAIEYENITAFRGLKSYWIENVTDYLFQVLVPPISIDVYKGGIQDYITISRPDSCKERIKNTIYKNEETWTHLLYSQ